MAVSRCGDEAEIVSNISPPLLSICLLTRKEDEWGGEIQFLFDR